MIAFFELKKLILAKLVAIQYQKIKVLLANTITSADFTISKFSWNKETGFSAFFHRL